MSGKPSLKGKRKKASGRKPRPRVRVQTSRYGRELIVDETFASFQRPGGEIATGSVWDAIAAPLLALSPARRNDGVGPCFAFPLLNESDLQKVLDGILFCSHMSRGYVYMS